MVPVFNILKKEGETILKTGRKIYATVSKNPNPEYNWTVYFRTGISLSGYKTEDDAIKRAEKMRLDFIDVVTPFLPK